MRKSAHPLRADGSRAFRPYSILKVSRQIGQRAGGTNPDILWNVIIGTHFLLYSSDAEADRVFFRDILGLRSIDVGGGWLIFQVPPAEAAIHPLDGVVSQEGGHRALSAELYLMCDDLKSQIASLKQKNVECTEVVVAGWGLKTKIPLPSGGEIGLYQPRHATAFDLKPTALKSKTSPSKSRSPKKRRPEKKNR